MGSVVLVMVMVTVVTGHLVMNGSDGDGDDDDPLPRRTVYFNNPHLLTSYRRPVLREGETIAGVYIQEEAAGISAPLRDTANQELGVLHLQAAYDELTFVPAAHKDQDRVKEIAERVQVKLRQYESILLKNKRHVEDLYWWHLGSGLSQTMSCCGIDDAMLTYSETFGARISRDMTCDILPPAMNPRTFSPGQNLTMLFQKNLLDQPTLKWQYFVSTEGIHSEYPAHSFDIRGGCRVPEDDARHRDVYLHTVFPQPKRVVIVIDHGNSLSANQLVIAKAISRHLLNTLSHHDKVSVIALDSEPMFPRTDECLSREMAPATFEVKFHFGRFIDGLTKSKETTNHTLGFVKAFETVRNTFAADGIEHSETAEALIVYISRGLLSSLIEARVVLEAISEENYKLGDRVVINTYAVIDDGKPIMYEKNFLLDIADQNFQKYDIPLPENHRTKPGMMVAVNTTRNLSFSVGNFYLVLNFSTPNRSHYSVPSWDSVGKGLVVSLTTACMHGDRVVGVSGVDIQLADITEHITYFSGGDNSYAFMIDVTGLVIMYPSFPRPILATVYFVHTDIADLERKPGFAAVREKMLRLDSGIQILEVSENSTYTTSEDTDEVVLVRYVWKRVENTPYIVCIVKEGASNGIKYLKGGNVGASKEIVYHRIDKVSNTPQCRHLKNVATTKGASLFLSAASFLSPFEYLSQEETKRTIQSYMAYISDNTKLIANPGLKNHVRNDVAVVASVAWFWKEQFDKSSLREYVVRRYVSTLRGVFQQFPGSPVDKAYDPTRRPWFRRAMQYPGRVVLTAPYLDTGGAGYIVTLSHTVYEGRSATMHGPSDAVVAVMGIDLTLGYFHKLLLDLIPVCGEQQIRCFILDDRGYLIAHPDLIEPTGKGPVEQQHITHKEPLVANDILNHRGFVKKNLCNSFHDRTVQRFYSFNVSLTGVLSNLVHGEQCARYQVTAIPGTNTFLGIVNHTCDIITAFCPCSMVDRLCLNCNRMEQWECECPCECPLAVSLCSESPSDDLDDPVPICTTANDELRGTALVNHFVTAVELGGQDPEESDPVNVDLLEPCIKIECGTRPTESSCFGVLGCEWCQLESDGQTPLPQPYCIEQKHCFGGVYRARTPYPDEMSVMIPSEEFSIRPTPVGSVAGGMMACFLMLAFAFYCVRQHKGQLDSNNGASLTVNGMGSRHIALDEEEWEPHPGDFAGPAGPAGHANMILVNFENAIPVASPYRASPGHYRRPPPATTESDHGYSTMTPHEDSEHAAYVEPLLMIGRDRYRPMPGAVSIPQGALPAPPHHPASSRASSPAPRALSPTVPNNKHFTPLVTISPDSFTLLPERTLHIVPQPTHTLNAKS